MAGVEEEEEGHLQPEQQLMEAKAAMLRMFRFSARRGIGVFYSLYSLFLLAVAELLKLVASPYLTLAGVIVAGAALWYFSKAAGFRGFDRMAYSLEFLEGGESLAARRQRWYSRPAFFRLASIFWGGAFVVARVEGASSLSLLFLTAWMTQIALLRVFAFSGGDDVGVFERRLEDWAVVAVLPLMVICFAATGSLALGYLVAAPIYLVSGLKSLYDAPGELTRVVS
jgi:hypothetical protein